jgi:hypothetical protein
VELRSLDAIQRGRLGNRLFDRMRMQILKERWITKSQKVVHGIGSFSLIPKIEELLCGISQITT